MQLISIKVIANSRTNEIITGGEIIKVKVSTPAEDGKANIAVIKLIAEKFDLKKSDIEIVKGEKSNQKVLRINSNKKLF